LLLHILRATAITLWSSLEESHLLFDDGLHGTGGSLHKGEHIFATTICTDNERWPWSVLFPSMQYINSLIAHLVDFHLPRTTAINAPRISVLTLNLHTPKSIAWWTNPAGMPEAPWSTNGIPVLPRVLANLSKSRTGGSTAYLPCTLPIVTAMLSTPVRLMKSGTL